MTGFLREFLTKNESGVLMSRYIKEFCSLVCFEDVMAVVSPVHNLPKEITESMAVKRRLRPFFSQAGHGLGPVLDLCAGNGLTGVLAAHLFDVDVISIDKRRRERHWELVERYKYLEQDVRSEETRALVDSKTVLVAVHPCGELPYDIVDMYNEEKAMGLILLPCCLPSKRKRSRAELLPELTRFREFYWKQMGADSFFSLDLASRCEGRVSIHVDEDILSPRRHVIVAVRD